MNSKTWNIIGNIFGTIALVAIVVGFCYICCAVSGYNWQ